MGLFDFVKKAEKSAFGKEPGMDVKIVTDPYKTKVSSPLSNFLAGQIGKGIGEYETDPNYTNRYNEFMAMNPGEYFDKNIAAPEIKRYKENLLPVIREGFAGNLRGSGRFAAEEAGINQFSENLARMGADFIPSFAKQQIDVGQTEFARRYTNWYNSLSETNPALSTAIQFLNSDSGYNVLSALNPGTQGWFGDLLKAAAAAGTAVAATGCWVAAEVFDGWEDIRTMRARYYINYHAPKWFKEFYLTHGAGIASFIRKHTWLKVFVRPLFNFFAKKGDQYASL